MACGDGLELFLYLSSSLWRKLDVPEVTDKFFLEFTLERRGGLMISFDGFGLDCGTIVIRSEIPQHIQIEADTLLQTLEGTNRARVVLDDAEKALAWASDLALRLCRLDQYWSEDAIFDAIQARQERIYGHHLPW
jgi:hypothetical protein